MGDPQSSPWLFQYEVMVIHDDWVITGGTPMTWETCVENDDDDWENHHKPIMIERKSS